MTPAPAGPPSEPSPLTRLLLGVVGVTVRMEGLQGDRGHCNPPQWNLAMTIATVFARRRGRQPPNESRAVSSVPGFVGVASVCSQL